MVKRQKTGGRDKGTPNKLTSETRNIIHSILSEELPNLRKYISEIEKPELKAKLLIDLLPYTTPKYHTIQLASQTDTKIVVRFKDAE